ncbi:MAG: hypothetical protein KGK44_04710 [Gammaproteobacteria bacterium]|nr:hypothetical protein [Gammaproteobacteria bacterium]
MKITNTVFCLLFITTTFLLPGPNKARAQSLPKITKVSVFQMNGRDLLQLCAGANSNIDMCDQFINGVRAGADSQRLFLGFALVKTHTEPPRVLIPLLTHEPYCLPDTVTNQDIRKTVIHFVQNLSEQDKIKTRAGFDILLALNSSYPCHLDDKP